MQAIFANVINNYLLTSERFMSFAPTNDVQCLFPDQIKVYVIKKFSAEVPYLQGIYLSIANTVLYTIYLTKQLNSH